MRYDYYERLWEYERRRIEEARLDVALAAAIDSESLGNRMKVSLGRTMIRLGAWLAGEQIALSQPATR